MNKRCIVCGLSKDIEEFNKDKSSKDGYRNTCKFCRNSKDKRIRKNKKIEVGIEGCLECEWADISEYKFDDGSQSIKCLKYLNFVGFTKNNKYNDIHIKCQGGMV